MRGALLAMVDINKNLNSDKYYIENLTNNPFLSKYNEICSRKYKTNEKLSLHHILPRSKFPDLKNDTKNHAWLPTLKHVEAHYCLWKFSPLFALEFWFPLVYFKKRNLFNITDEEYDQLKKDLKYCRKLKKEGTFQKEYNKVINFSN